MSLKPYPRQAGGALLPVLPPLIVIAIGLDTIYGRAIDAWLERGPGDNGDSRIMLFLIESSWRALKAFRTPVDPPMFFPVKHVLGYTDAHLLWVPLFGLLHSTGLGLVQAFTAMFILLTCFGLLCWWWLLRSVFRLSSPAAAMGGFAFAFSNALTIKLGHGQMIGVTVLPLILLLMHRGFARCRVRPALAAGILIGLLAATSYIVTWFFLFIGAIAGAIALVAIPEFRAALLRRDVLRVLGALLLGLVIGLIPFGIIYFPMIVTGQRRIAHDVRFFHPWLSDLINLGGHHPYYGSLMERFGLPYSDPNTNAERFMGFSLPLWALTIGGLVVVARRNAWSMAERALLCVVAATVFATALQFVYPDRIYPWNLVLRFVPGGSAIRTTFRSQIDALLPVTALAAIALDTVLRRIPIRILGLAAFLLLAWLAMLESIGDTSAGGLYAADERALLAGVPAPPAGCRVFGLAPQPPAGRPGWMMQSDALMFSLRWRLPTVNGNSSWTPPGWGLIEPSAPDYAQNLRAWVQDHHLATNFCAYREDQRRWLTPHRTPLRGRLRMRSGMCAGPMNRRGRPGRCPDPVKGLCPLNPHQGTVVPWIPQTVLLERGRAS